MMLLFIFLFGQSDARQRLHLPLRTKLSAQRKESDSYGSSKNELTKVDHMFLSVRPILLREAYLPISTIVYVCTFKNKGNT